jgi:uncharacterized protein
MKTQANTQYTNALINEISPYLLQHAHNPVQWYPWGEEAINLAKEYNKPILLSIGYSACHWCHVMAHESFENLQAASLMNDLFINIKVDREERPDLDKIYQMAHHLITQRTGGWPLTLFLSPEDQYPFFGGTYFPPQPRYGMPAFTDLLKKVAAFYHDHQDQIQAHQQSLSKALNHHETLQITQINQLNEAPFNLAREELAESFDKIQGGFGGAPKFPHIPNIERLLHHYMMTAQQSTPDASSLDMALFTLKKMALGGLYDQLGGGFCRYSVDELWMIPHFEKMLYDNGPFLTIYSQAWQILQNQSAIFENSDTLSQKEDAELFQRTVLETADWVSREMLSKDGGFYSTLDADSEGEEGKFYVWTKDKVKNLLDTETYKLFAYHFGLNRAANFEGKWHLHVFHERDKTAKHFDLSLEELNSRLEQAQAILFEHREQRVRPMRDEKMLTSWNALMIKGMATAGLIFDRQDYLEIAEKALDFIQQKLWVNGRLLATIKEDKAHLNAYLDDYAFLLEAILTLLQARWREGDLSFAIALAEVLLSEFFDTEQGGFYFTGHHHEALISRPKSFTDDSTPSGNGIAALALGRLGFLLGESRYLDAAEKTLQAAWPHITQMPSAHSTLLLALEDYLFPPQTIILRGEADRNLKIWQAACQKDYAPQRLCFPIPNDATDLPNTLTEKKAQASTVAYICTGHQCSMPITSLDELLRQL